MYIVIYEFKVKMGKKEQFEKNWAIHTDNINKYYGSLGSRLHKTENELTYMAYAQWPSKEVYDSDKSSALKKFTQKDLESRDLMLDALESTETKFLANVLDDRLKT